MPEPHDILPRRWTPEVRNPDGSHTLTVKRCCNGCGEQLGDVTMIEINLGIAGEPLPDVRPECPRCRPLLLPPAALVPKSAPAQPEAHDDRAE
jgi:hypothetical protein